MIFIKEIYDYELRCFWDAYAYISCEAHECIYKIHKLFCSQVSIFACSCEQEKRQLLCYKTYSVRDYKKAFVSLLVMKNFCLKLNLLDNCSVLLTDYSRPGMTEKSLPNWKDGVAALLHRGSYSQSLTKIQV